MLYQCNSAVEAKIDFVRSVAQQIYYLRLKNDQEPNAENVIKEADDIFTGVKNKYAKELAEEKAKAKKRAEERLKKLGNLAQQAVKQVGTDDIIAMARRLSGGGELQGINDYIGMPQGSPALVVNDDDADDEATE